MNNVLMQSIQLSTLLEVSVKKTFPIPPGEAWRMLLSHDAVNIWSGKTSDQGELYPGKILHNTAGDEIVVRIMKERSHIRLTWKEENSKNSSVAQIRIFGGNNGTFVSIHHNNLTTECHQEQMRIHWEAVLVRLEALIPASLYYLN